MEELNICGRNLLNLDVTEGGKNIYGGIFGDENVRDINRMIFRGI